MKQMKNKGFALLEVMFAMALAAFMIMGVFTFFSYLLNMSIFINHSTAKREKDVLIYYCYAPLMSKSLVDKKKEDGIMGNFSVVHGHEGEFNMFDHLCRVMYKDEKEPRLLLYCYGDKKNEKK